MLDTGCSKTVILKSALPPSCELTPSNTQLLCANEQRLQAETTKHAITIVFNDNLSEKLTPLVTNKLSCDIIVGVDCLKSFSYKENARTANVNGFAVDLIQPHDSSRIARACGLDESMNHPRLINANSTISVPVRNPFFGSKHETVQLVPFDVPLPQCKNLEIIPTVYKNTKNISVAIKNNSKTDVSLAHGIPVCRIKPLDIEKVNGLTVVSNLDAERDRTRQFQQRRSQKAEEVRFQPDIEDYGDVTESQKEQLQALIQKYRLCFSMDESNSIYFGD